MKKTIYSLAILGTIVASLSGCGTFPSDESDVSSTFPYVRLSPSAPPEAPCEEIYQTETPMREVWRKGFWDYDGKEFTWIAGHYIERPDPTATWIPDRWEQRTFGWAFIPGYWQ